MPETKPIECTHPEEFQTTEIVGDFRYEGGDIYDTQRIVLVCTRCGQVILDETEAWDEKIPF